MSEQAPNIETTSSELPDVDELTSGFEDYVPHPTWLALDEAWAAQGSAFRDGDLDLIRAANRRVDEARKDWVSHWRENRYKTN